MTELLTEQQVAALLQVKIKGLQAWRSRGGGPPFVKLGRCVRYRLEDLEAFLTASRRASTSDQGYVAMASRKPYRWNPKVS